MKIRHFVLTRMTYSPSRNCVVWGKERPLTSAFARWRLEMTKATAAPCIASQIVPIEWVVLVADDDPFRYERIDMLEETGVPYHTFPRLTPVQTADDVSHPWGRMVTSLLDGSEEMIITTRLDDDDAIRFDYAAAIQDAVAPNKTETLVSPLGYYLLRKRLLEKTHPSNQFLSVQSPPENLVTCMDFNHNHTTKCPKRRNFKALPGNGNDRMWLWLRHSYTKSIGARSRARLGIPGSLKSRFRCNWEWLKTEDLV